MKLSEPKPLCLGRISVSLHRCNRKAGIHLGMRTSLLGMDVWALKGKFMLPANAAKYVELLLFTILCSMYVHASCE